MPDRFLSVRIRIERDNHVGRIGTKLTQNPSVYNKLKAGPAGRALASSETVLPASPAVTKTKRSLLGSRITNKTNR